MQGQIEALPWNELSGTWVIFTGTIGFIYYMLSFEIKLMA